MKSRYNGVTKRMRIVRRVQESQSTSEEKIVEFAVKPGWKTGNKVTFKQWVMGA